MGWIYLAESADSPWPCNQWSDQSHTVRAIDSLNLYSFHAWQAGHYPKLPYGMTYEHSNWETLVGPATSISFMGDSLARTSVLQDLEQAWEESEADLLSMSLGYLANFDQNSFSWKTSQQSLFEDLEILSVEWPRWGMTVDGLFYQPEKLEPFICEKDGGYLPTPTAMDIKRGIKGTQGGYLTCPALALRGELPGHPTGYLNPEWTELAMGYQQGWTELKDWAMQWFRNKREKRSCA